MLIVVMTLSYHFGHKLNILKPNFKLLNKYISLSDIGLSNSKMLEMSVQSNARLIRDAYSHLARTRHHYSLLNPRGFESHFPPQQIVCLET